jgi:hypothetical protein
MKSHLHRRLNKLTATIGSRSGREYTLEERAGSTGGEASAALWPSRTATARIYARSLIRSNARRAAKAIEIDDIEARVTELEHAAAAQKGS